MSARELRPEGELLQPWQMAWCGRTWMDMPGSDFDERKITFALWRRGLVNLEEPEDLFEDGKPLRMRVVVSVPFGKMGMARSMQQRAARDQRQEASSREAAKRQMQHDVWRAALRQRLTQLKARQFGALRQLSRACDLCYDNVLKFVREGTKLGTARLKLLEAKLDAVDAGAFVFQRASRAGLQVATPAGHVPFKVYVAAMAERRGLKPHSYYAWLQRNVDAMPVIHKVHGRAWFVSEADMQQRLAEEVSS